MTDSEMIERIGTRELARRLGLQPSAVSHWKRRGIPFPRRIDMVEFFNDYITDHIAFLRGEGRK